MRIGIANDHGGTELKFVLHDHLRAMGHVVRNYGTNTGESVDYPDYAKLLVDGLNQNECDFGIAICGTGIGISMACNRVNGIRALLCYDVTGARLAREHGDCNVLCLGGRIVADYFAMEIVETFIQTKFDGGRHLDRINKLDTIFRNTIN